MADEYREILYVNAYRVTRHYGGPEEGGWWYDEGEPLASVPIVNPTDEEIEKLKDLLHEMIGWKSKHKRGSVLGGGDFEVYVEKQVARPYPEGRPHYE